ncbi:MAG: hypothetical protein ABIW82_03850 [Dokdonella sp.]
MKIFAIALAILVIATSTSGAFAQSAPVRGVGLLALNASDARSSAGGPSGARTTLIEVPDGGGGGLVGVRATRGSGDGGRFARDTDAPVAPDALPAKASIAPGDPTAPTTMAPKRTNYRWQALVPGAIK